MSTIEKVAENKMFGGQQCRFRHHSESTQCDMTFSVYLPPVLQKSEEKVPAVLWLSGLTCTDENFVQKAGAQRVAAELGLMLVAPDTSPRGEGVPDDPDGNWDFGLGAGFYVNATQAPYAQHYRMFDYVNEELPALLAKHFPWNGKLAISGHSMGGHGALISAAHFPDRFSSVSAFAPICSPVACPWGEKAFSRYLGADQTQWERYDACKLILNKGLNLPTLVDQGLADDFLPDQLRIDQLKIAASGHDNVQIREHRGYDHSYFFIASFIEEHLRFHAQHWQDQP
jgi:S-formylglutathione hydrolase